MPLTRFQASSQFPGVSTDEQFVAENQVVQGRWEKTQEFMGVISSTARDANSSTTTTLRNGLLLGKDSSGELTHFDPTGLVANSSKALDLILVQDLNLLGPTNSAEDKFEGRLLAAGVVDPSSLVVAGNAARGIVGDNYEYHIRKQLAASGNFILEDSPVECPLMSWRYEDAKTADYTLVEGDRDILWTNEGDDGAIVFTLPTVAKKDLAYYFFVVADQDVTVASGTADEIMTINDIAADSIKFGTTGEKIGGSVAIIGDGAKWKVLNLSSGNTITVAT